MFLTRKFKIPFCEITDDTPNYCLKVPVAHRSLCLRHSDMTITISKTAVKSSRIMWEYTCMYIYVYIRVQVLKLM